MTKRGSTVRRRDKYGQVWEIDRTESNHYIEWDASTASAGGRYTASVTAIDSSGKFRPMAWLDDIRVDPRKENRGVGSMLLREVITACRSQGHRGIEGELSLADSDHFDKLKHFYEKHGFTVTFYPRNHPKNDGRRLGDISLVF